MVRAELTLLANDFPPAARHVQPGDCETHAAHSCYGEGFQQAGCNAALNASFFAGALHRIQCLGCRRQNAAHLFVTLVYLGGTVPLCIAMHQEWRRCSCRRCNDSPSRIHCAICDYNARMSGALSHHAEQLLGAILMSYSSAMQVRWSTSLLNPIRPRHLLCPPRASQLLLQDLECLIRASAMPVLALQLAQICLHC